MRKGDETDPKGLIADAYRIEGIELKECRTIFMDWALSVPQNADHAALIAALIERHGEDGHPMTQVLREGLDKRADPPRRRGGPAGRRRNP